MMTNTIGKLVPWVVGAVALLYLTPIGNDLRALIGGGAAIWAFLLVWTGLADLFGSGGLKSSAKKFAGAIALLGLAALMTVGYHPSTGGGDICWDGRNNPRC